jgi:flagellum-specific ATP synthase
MSGELLARTSAALGGADLARCHGRVNNLIGLIIEATGLHAEVGEVCLVGATDRSSTEAGRHSPSTDSGDTRCARIPESTSTPVSAEAGGHSPPASIPVAASDRAAVPAEVVGFREGRTLLMPLGELQGIGPGTKVLPSGAPFRVPVGSHLLGRVLDGLGAPLDGLGGVGGDRHEGAGYRSTIAPPPSALHRPRIHDRVALGVRALDSLVPCGRGQRLGIFAGSGVGKSSLLGMIARSTSATVNVIALVGERGREVREFVERDLGEALERSVVVVATSDEPALVRIKAAFTATTIAEHFRDHGHHVMLMMDSVTRFATAQREIGLAIGEPPATRGYTPSVFALLPRLLERAGTSPQGSITGLYTVLVDGDDMNEPVADAVRSILDGHIVLTRSLAHAGHYPAIDVLQSVSRLTGEIVSPQLAAAGQRLRSALAALREKEDLIAIGAYQSGSDPLLDATLEHRARIEAFLRQPVEEPADPATSDECLLALCASLERSLAQRSGEILDAEEVLPGIDGSSDLEGGTASDLSGASAIPALGLNL